MTKTEAVRFLVDCPAQFGRSVGFTKLGKLQNKWIADMVVGEGDKTLQAHRGSYKTTCVSLALALILVLLPNTRTLFLRKTDDDIKEVIKQTVKILQSKQLRSFVKVIYGVDLKLITQNANEITTNLTTDIRGTSQLVGMGIGGSITGKHFDRIFTDDIVNVSDRISKVEREHTKVIYQELQNIKNRGGRIFNTGTPWHKDDCFLIMPPAEKWDCYSTGIISPAELEGIKAGMTASLFATNYELKHISSEGAIYRAFYDNPERFGVDKKDVPPMMIYSMGVDFGGNRSGHAFVFSGITSDYSLYTLKSAYYSAEGMPVDQLVAHFKIFCDECIRDYGRIDAIYPDCAEQTIINTLRESCHYRIYNSIKNNILDRIRAMCLLLGNGRYFYVRGENDELVKGLQDARWDEKKHDDARLDDFSSNIDILDASEYSWEYWIYNLTQIGREKNAEENY